MKNKKLYVLGVGHNTPVFINIALDCGYDIAGLYHFNDDRTGEFDHGFKILGSFNDLFCKSSLHNMHFMLSMGDLKIRKELHEKILTLGGCLPTIIHPTAVVSKFANISQVGVIISPMAYVEADSVIMENTVILNHVNISHTSSVGRNCFIAGGTTIGAYTEVEDNVFIGQSVLSIAGKVNRIGTGSFIGAGSLLTREVEKYTMVVGRPARITKKMDKSECQNLNMDEVD